jgi:hypothetical protein
MSFVGRWARVLGVGLLAGLVAALFMTVVMALLRLTLGISLPAEMGGDRFLPYVIASTVFSRCSASSAARPAPKCSRSWPLSRGR